MTAYTDQDNQQLVDHVRTRHNGLQLDGFHSLETIRDEHRRAHELGHPGHDQEDLSARDGIECQLCPPGHHTIRSHADVASLRFLEAVPIANPNRLGQTPVSDELAAEVAAYRRT
jgi:hypothetical protein